MAGEIPSPWLAAHGTGLLFIVMMAFMRTVAGVLGHDADRLGRATSTSIQS